MLLSAPLLGPRLGLRHVVDVLTGLSGSLLLLAQGRNLHSGALIGHLYAAGATPVPNGLLHEVPFLVSVNPAPNPLRNSSRTRSPDVAFGFRTAKCAPISSSV